MKMANLLSQGRMYREEEGETVVAWMAVAAAVAVLAKSL